MSIDVSVVIPVYNGEKTIASAVERLLTQKTAITGSPDATFEIVIVDDGSSDSSFEIASALAGAHPNVHAFRMLQNSGVAAARELAVSHSTGEYVWMIDDDDEWADDAITTLLAAARSTRADVVVAGARYVYSTGASDRVVGDEHLVGELTTVAAFRLFLGGRISGHLWNKLFRRTILSPIEFTRVSVHSDQAMVAQLITNASRITAIDTVVYRYLVRSGSIVRSGKRRSGSLLTVGSVVANCAARLGREVVSSDDFIYYYHRFIVASALKDTISGAYSPADQKVLFAQIRREITFRGLYAVTMRSDIKRLILLLSALCGLHIFRLVTGRAKSVT